MSTEVTPRWPKFDFDKVDVIWSKHPEFAILWNAMSTCAPIAEPYLNQVMLRCAQKIDPDKKYLQELIQDFVKQESNHYRMHIQYNRKVYAAGYDMGKGVEAEMKESLRDLFDNRSLAFNAGYCAGFENFTLFTAKFMFEAAQDLFEGGDPNGRELWLWHMAEEYEHRSVCHDVFEAVSGNYFTRVYALIYSFFHLDNFTGGIGKLFLAKYREGMTEAERAASIKREKEYKRRYALFAFPRMLKILIPFYNPAKAKSPRNLDLALERYTAMSV